MSASNLITANKVGWVIYAHRSSGIAATAFETISFLVKDWSLSYGKVGYHDLQGLSIDPDERHRVAERLRDNSYVLMRNRSF